jgi:hypothetical protein
MTVLYNQNSDGNTGWSIHYRALFGELVQPTVSERRAAA